MPSRPHELRFMRLLPQRNEPHRVQPLPRYASVGSPEQPEMLYVRGADRDDAAAAFGELVDQFFRQHFRRGGGQDGVEWRVVAEDLHAVAHGEDDVGDAELREAAGDDARELGLDFGAVDDLRQPREDRGLVSRSRSDLQYFFVAA